MRPSWHHSYDHQPLWTCPQIPFSCLSRSTTMLGSIVSEFPSITVFVGDSDSVVVAPEGTRSKNGVPKKFQARGLRTLFKGIPSAVVVPITINNSWLSRISSNYSMVSPLNIFHNSNKQISCWKTLGKGYFWNWWQDYVWSMNTRIYSKLGRKVPANDNKPFVKHGNVFSRVVPKRIKFGTKTSKGS